MSTVQALNELRSDFVRLAEAQQDATPQPPAHRPRLHLHAFAAAAAIGCAAAGAVILSTTGGGGGPTRSAAAHTGTVQLGGVTLGGHGLQGANLPLPKIGRDPFAEGGRQVSLARAIAKAGYAFLVPSAPAANRHNLSYVWITRGGAVREVALQYASTGVRVFIKPALPTFKQDPRRQFEMMARELHLGRGAVQTIGQDVLFVQAKRGLSGGPSVEMIYTGADRQLEIDIIGSSQTTAADLIAVARSIADAGR